MCLASNCVMTAKKADGTKTPLGLTEGLSQAQEQTAVTKGPRTHGRGVYQTSGAWSRLQ